MGSIFELARKSFAFTELRRHVAAPMLAVEVSNA